MKKFKVNEKLMVAVDIEKKQVVQNDGKPKKYDSKSQVFKELYDLGVDIADISRLTDSHYSFVYGVVSSKCKMRDTNKVSKSDKIRDLADAGKTPGEIAKELNANYSFVFSVVKKHKSQKSAK